MLSPSRATAVLSLLALTLAGCSSGSSKKAAVVTPATTGAPGLALTIASFAYDPTPLTVSPGAVVAVRNTDGAEHTVTSDTAGLFVADDVTHGNTVTFTAPKAAGTYTFHCQYHASMHGTLIVK